MARDQSFNQIIADLKAQRYSPVYFLYGDENYFINRISDYLQHQVLNETEKAFNLTILYGKDTDHRTVVDYATRYPVASEWQVVMIKEAQEMRTLEELKDYISRPMTSTILAIFYRHKRPDFRTSFGKVVKAHAVAFESKRIYDNQLPGWIHQFVRNAGFAIGDEAVYLLAEHLGSDLEKVENELKKLTLVVSPGSEITADDIEQNIGISKEYNIFELQKAIAGLDFQRASAIVNYFRSNPKQNPLIVVIFSLFSFFRKVYLIHTNSHVTEGQLLKIMGLRSPFFLKEYRQAARHFDIRRTEHVFDVLHRYDLRSKGYDASPSLNEGEIMREMIYHLMH